MAKSSSFDNALMLLVFQGTSMTGIAQNISASPNTNLYFALHTADPTAAGNQSSNEVTYTSYARVAVARTSSGFTVTGNSVSPVASVTFPSGTGGSGTATNWSVGLSPSGAGTILYTGAISPNIVCGSGVVPILTTASTITES